MTDVIGTRKIRLSIVFTVTVNPVKASCKKTLTVIERSAPSLLNIS